MKPPDPHGSQVFPVTRVELEPTANGLKEQGLFVGRKKKETRKGERVTFSSGSMDSSRHEFS